MAVDRQAQAGVFRPLRDEKLAKLSDSKVNLFILTALKGQIRPKKAKF
jgi:hypothetical protein